MCAGRGSSGWVGIGSGGQSVYRYIRRQLVSSRLLNRGLGDLCAQNASDIGEEID